MNLSKRTILALIVLLVLAISIPVAVLLAMRQQDVRQRAAEPTQAITALATIDGQPITREELLTYADKLYKTPPSDTASLQPILDELIENKLVTKVASENNLTASPDEVTTQIDLQGLSTLANTPEIVDAARIAVLKKKIEKTFTKSREAYTVGFWIPPKDYGVTLTAQQASLVESQRKAAAGALTEIENRMLTDENALQIAQDIATKYPPLAPIIAVNGYILEKKPNPKLLELPILYSYQKGRSSVDFFATLFKLQTNQVGVTKFTKSTDGGTVIKVTAASDGQYDNYTDWLNDIRSKRTKVNHL